MKSIFIIMLSAILVDNFVLSKFMGICPFLGVSKKLSSSLGMGAAVIFVMTCATAVTYPVYSLILEPNGLEYLNTVAFILIIALFVQLVEIILKKVMPPLYNSLGVYLPLITTNCAVLGVTLLNIDNGYTFLESIINAVCARNRFLTCAYSVLGSTLKTRRRRHSENIQGNPRNSYCRINRIFKLYGIFRIYKLKRRKIINV